MKRSLQKLAWSVAILAGMLLAAFPASAASGIDPLLYFGHVRHASEAGKEAAGEAPNASGSVLVKAREIGSVVETVRKAGGRARIVAGDIASVTAPLELLEQMAEAGDIEYAEADKPLTFMLDKSLPAIGATGVKAGEIDGVAYDGSGVIVGIIDTGIDWRHSVFNDAYGNSRIISIWDQGIESADGFAAPAGMEGPYGIECLHKDIEDKTCPSKDEVGHGTHVAGIAAGRDALYEGMAPGAELVVVKASSDVSGSFSTSLIDAVDYIMDVAAQEQKPVVINMSLGTHYGAHDGTSLLEQALDAKINEAPGRIIVASAGNNNHQSDNVIASVHASTELQGDECRFEFLGFSTSVREVFIDVWQGEGAALTFGIGVDSYGSYEQAGPVGEGDIYDQTLDDGKLRVVVDSTETANPENNRKHTVVYLGAADDGDASIDHYAFDFIASGTGVFDAWTSGGAYFTKREGTYLSSGHRYCPGDSMRTVVIPATAKEVLSVASFVTRDDLWPLARDMGSSIELTPVDWLSPFSSPGPSGDSSRTGQKPEITAPGEMIISALSYDAVNSLVGSGYAVDNDRRFVAMAGTSMSAPHVAGAIALMLQRKPDLTASQVEMLLARNARVVSKFPDNHWGYGIVDLSKTFANFDSTDLQTPLPVDDQDVSESPFSPQPLPQLTDGSPSSGNGGCGLIGKSKQSAGTPFVFGMILLVLAAAVRGMVRRSGCLMIFILLFSFLASCGSSSAPTETEFDQNVSIADSSIKIDAQQMIAYVWMWDSNNTTSMLLVIPLKHFFPNESMQMSADNFYTFDADRATLLVMNADDISVFNGMSLDEAIANSTGAWLSTGGKVTIYDSSVKDKGKVQLQFEGVEMRPMDRESLMLDRDGEASFLYMSLIGEVSEGIGDDALVTDAEPLSGALGTRVVVKGLNFTSDTKAHFSGCPDYDLPVELKSENELEVTISTYCRDNAMEIGGEFTDQQGWNPTFVFDDVPGLWIKSLPYPESDLLKVVHDTATDYVYMLFKPGVELQIYSTGDKGFVAPKPLSAAAETFDIAPDGTLITAKDKVITIVAPDGTIQAQIDLPKGDFVADLTSGPGQKILVMNDYQDLWMWSGGCVLDRSALSVECPSELILENSNSSKSPVMTTRADRRLVTGMSDDDVAIYRFNENGSVEKLADDRLSSVKGISLHPLRDEVWTENRVYALDLSDLRYLYGSPAYPSPRAERYYELRYGNISIFSDDEVQEEIPYSSYEDSGDEYGNEIPKSVIISDNDRYLTVIWNEKIRQVDMSPINAYLDVQ